MKNCYRNSTRMVEQHIELNERTTGFQTLNFSRCQNFRARKLYSKTIENHRSLVTDCRIKLLAVFLLFAEEFIISIH